MSTILRAYNADSVNTWLSTAVYVAGACKAQIEDLEKNLSSLPDDEFIKSLERTVNTNREQKSNIDKIHAQINQLKNEDSLKKPLLGQVRRLRRDSTSFEGRLDKIFKKAFERVLESKIKEVEEKAERSYEILNHFRLKPTEANQVAMQESVNNFSDAVKQLHQLSVRYPFLLSEEKHKDFKRIDDLLFLFTSQISTEHDKNKISPLINRAVVLFHPSSSASINDKAEWIEQFERQFKFFPKMLQDQFDRHIRDLSPELKRGKEWRKNHRYDDFNVFKQALAQTLQGHFEASYKSRGISYPIDIVYKVLHRLGLGPVEQDPIAWVKDNFFFVLDLIETIEDEHLIQMEEEMSSRKNG